MNLEYHIYQYLLKYQKAEVPDFGVFELTKESAKIDAENSIITPPHEVITFTYLPAQQSDLLSAYIAGETGTEDGSASKQIGDTVCNWQQTLQSGQILTLESLGQLQLDDQKNVVKISSQDFDPFGLEAINLQTLRKRVVKKYASSEDYPFSKNVLWIFFSFIIAVSAVLFLLGDPQAIFGKSSHIPVANTVKKTSPKKVVTAPKTDSTKTDSIKSTTNAKIQKINR